MTNAPPWVQIFPSVLNYVNVLAETGYALCGPLVSNSGDGIVSDGSSAVWWKDGKFAGLGDPEVKYSLQNTTMYCGGAKMLRDRALSLGIARGVENTAGRAPRRHRRLVAWLIPVLVGIGSSPRHLTLAPYCA
jgi:hypothetical protein